MKRDCRLAEHATVTEVIEGLAPAPWVVRRCRETGFVFLENPPGYESLKEDLAWQVTYLRESRQRASAEPIRYTLSRRAKHQRRKVECMNWRDSFPLSDSLYAVLRRHQP